MGKTRTKTRQRTSLDASDTLGFPALSVPLGTHGARRLVFPDRRTMVQALLALYGKTPELLEKPNMEFKECVGLLKANIVFKSVLLSDSPKTARRVFSRWQDMTLKAARMASLKKTAIARLILASIVNILVETVPLAVFSMEDEILLKIIGEAYYKGVLEVEEKIDESGCHSFVAKIVDKEGLDKMMLEFQKDTEQTIKPMQDGCKEGDGEEEMMKETTDDLPWTILGQEGMIYIIKEVKRHNKHILESMKDEILNAFNKDVSCILNNTEITILERTEIDTLLALVINNNSLMKSCLLQRVFIQDDIKKLISDALHKKIEEKKQEQHVLESFRTLLESMKENLELHATDHWMDFKMKVIDKPEFITVNSLSPVYASNIFVDVKKKLQQQVKDASSRLVKVLKDNATEIPDMILGKKDVTETTTFDQYWKFIEYLNLNSFLDPPITKTSAMGIYDAKIRALQKHK